jgi:cytochrome c oxidase subunit 1
MIQEATLGHAGAAAHEKSGIWSWITTVDHKRIGLMYGVTAFVFFLLGGLEALLIRYQLMVPNNTAVSAEFFNALFTMHATTMVFLAIMPLSAAFFNYFVPLMIGARDVAFPRLNAFSYWLFLFGGLFINWSFIAGTPPDGGWFGYAPLSGKALSPSAAMDYWNVGLQILGVASLAAGFNFIVTIFNLRAPGMSMMRMPVFVWMTLVVQFLVVLSFPIITVGLIFLMFDRSFGTNFYVVANGGDPLLWQHLFWLFGHPEVYILILPAMGIVSEVLPTFSRKPLFGAPFVIFSGMAIGFLGFGVWSHHMFASGMGPVADAAFSAATMLIAIPTGVKIFNWIATIWGGHLQMKTPMYFALGFVAMFTIGGLSGVMHASPPIDLQQTDTYFVVAHIHYVLFGGAIMGIFCGIYYWFPKMTGRMLDETLGKAHFWLLLVAFNLTFFPMHFLGIHGMPRRVYTYDAGLGFETWNMVASIGSFVLGGSMLIFIYNALTSLKRGKLAGNDPWDGATLEWALPSPPPEYNFAQLPQVESERPVWDAKYGGQKSNLAEINTPTGHIHMPNPSYWPLVTATGPIFMAMGLIASRNHAYMVENLGVKPEAMVSNASPFFLAFGLFTLVYGIYRWAFEPAE